MISQGSTQGEIILCTPQTREYIDCNGLVMMVFSAQLGDVGGKGVKALTLSHTHSLEKLARAGCSQIHSL